MKRLVWLVPAVLLAACATSAAPSFTNTGGFATSAGGGAPAQPASRDATAGKAVPQPPVEGPKDNGVPVPQAFDPDRALILTASISMRASDPWAVSDKAQQVAIGLGGDVMGLTQSGTKDDRTATLALRVPADRFNDALRQLRALDADVVSSTVDGKDVTDQFVDLKARLAAKQAEEQRYLALLARADKIDDILKIDQSLASVRTQIEQLTGQINSISARTKFSTITVSIAPLGAPVGEPRPVWDPSRTAAQALAALATMLRAVADLAIWLLVFAWIPLLGLGVVVALTRAARPTRGAA